MTTSFFEASENKALCRAYFTAENSNAPELDKAISLAAKFRLSMDEPGFWPYQKTKGYFVTRKSIEAIFDQDNPNIKGLKIYFGEAVVGGMALQEVIIVGADAEGEDFGIPTKKDDPIPTNIVIGDARPCPIHCGKDNHLNTNKSDLPE